MKNRVSIFLLLLLLAAFALRNVSADSNPPGAGKGKARDKTVYEAMHLLKNECFTCHNEEKKKGGLVLTARERLLEGGDSGPAVVLDKPDSSRLLEVLAAGADPHMPPKKQLTAAQVKLIRDWIKSGVPYDVHVLAEEEPITPVALTQLPAGYQPVLALALSSDGQKLAAGHGGTLAIYNASPTNFPLLAQMSAHRDAIQAIAWSGDGQQLASAGFRHVVLWNAATLQPSREWTNGLAGRITGLRFTKDNQQLVLADGVAGRSGHVRLLDLNSGKITASWRAHEDAIYALDLSRDGRRLATAGGDKWIKIWDLARQKEIARLEGHTAQVLAVAFNTNATQVVSGGADKQLKVWDIETRERIITLGKQDHAITSVSWPGDGQTIYASADDGTLLSYRNLKVHSGEQSSRGGEEKQLGEVKESLLCLTVAPDAKTVFTGSHDGGIQVWNSQGKQLALLNAPQSVPKPNLSPLAVTNHDFQADSPSWLERIFGRSPRSRADTNVAPNRTVKARILSLVAEPKSLRLTADAPRHHLLISAVTADGFEIDVTDQAKFSASRKAPFRVDDSGLVTALRPGDGIVTAKVSGQRVEITVRIEAASALAGSAESADPPGALVLPPVSFVRDVLPVLSKAGCNAGACHAKAEGQNGFKLSVFSYDPKSDHAEIVKDARGRRVFPAAPEESLIIQKPTTRLPHEGGLRFKPGSETHRILLRWLRQGMPYQLQGEPSLAQLVVFPKERRYLKGTSQRLIVQAVYADGSVRDVTALASFDSNDKEIATVNENGRVTIGNLTGQGVIVARYMGFVADAHIIVPADRILPEAQYAALPRHNFIDDLAYAQFQRLGLFPSELCTDAEFLRRAKLDAIGVLPTPEEVRAFLADPAKDKRQAFIARVLEHPAYADYWANKWADLLRPNPDRVGVKSVFILDQWLRESFRQNKPYNEFVREILLVEGSNHREGPAVVYRDRREPAELTTMFSQLFLGTRLDCARCHHHPNEKWSQDDFYQFAAFFGSVKQKGAGLSPPISAGRETFYFASGGKVKHPVTGEVMPPRPPDGRALAVAETNDPRHALAEWLLAPENPFFARAAVNRVWGVFFGRGLVEPVDDFRISNPCANPALLDALAKDFVQHGYDLKHLMRTIMESRLYQLSSIPNEFNRADTRSFSRAYRRRLPAEVLLDAVNDATGVPDTFAATPPGSRAVQTWSYKIESQFMDAFSRPNPSSDCPCERDSNLTVVQALHLMNSKTLQSKLTQENGRARQLASSKMSPEEIISELYLATLNRPPTPSEMNLALKAFCANGATRQTATEDVLWALLNSAEFVLNH